ncbi:ciliary rootlet component, centrosome cohesion domain-containing protein [Ditylenchus destructor]|uniref:Ciliary rootlet component, centrosome cohesion domain-containing protein n=1 Tax=Ditylenchus destructor TaxID=166010 RepID=A0AAD4N6J2_9BILA|nr:ciliary rootlet component, centrosome cohesion domain-containing protein [Ditylenchus destructor]
MSPLLQRVPLASGISKKREQGSNSEDHFLPLHQDLLREYQMLLFTPSVPLMDLRSPSPSEGKVRKRKARFMSEERLPKQIDPDKPSTSASLPMLSASADDLSQVPHDLSNYRRRIDAGVEEQRRQREILERLQDKVLKCRLRSAESRGLQRSSSGYEIHDLVAASEELPSEQTLEPRPSTSSAFYRDISSSSPAFSRVRESTSQTIDVSRNNRFTRPYIASNPALEISPRLARRYKGRNEDDIRSLEESLRNEQSRTFMLESLVDSLRHQIQTTASTNETLCAEIVLLSQLLERRNSSGRDTHRQRHRNLTETLWRRLQETWIEFSALKRRMHDAKAEIQQELDTQKSEYARIKRFMNMLVEQSISMHESQQEKSKKAQEYAMNDLLQKYEEQVAKHVQIEMERDNFASELSKSEASLKRINTEKIQLDNAIQQLQQMPELTPWMERAHGARSLEATPQVASYSRQINIYNAIQTALQTQKSELDTLKRSTEHHRQTQIETEKEISSLKSELTATRKRHEEGNVAFQDIKAENERLSRKYTKVQEETHQLRNEKSLCEAAIESVNQKLVESQMLHETTLKTFEEERQSLLSQLQAANEGFLCERCRSLEAELRKLQEKIKVQELKEKQLHETLSREKQRSEHFEENLLESKRKAESFRNENQALLNRIGTTEHRINELEQDLAESRESTRLTETNIEQLYNEKSMLNSEKIRLTEHSLTLERKLAEQTAELKQNQQEAEQVAEEWQTKLKSLERIIHEHREVLHEHRSRLEMAEEQKNALQKELEDNEDEFRANLSAITQLKRDKGEIEDMLRRALREIENLQEALKREEEEKRHLKEKINENEQKIRFEQRKVDDLANNEHRATMKVKELTTELDIVKEKLAQMMSKFKSETQYYHDEIQRVEKLWELEVAKLKDEHKRESAKTVLPTKGKPERTVLDQKVEMQQSENKIKRVEENYQRTIDDLREKLANIEIRHEQEIFELTQAYEQKLTKQKGFAQSIEEDLRKAETKVKESIVREADLKTKLENAESRISKGAQMIQKLYTELEELSEQSESQNLQAETELSKMRSELAKLNSEATELSESLTQQRHVSFDLEEKLRTSEERRVEQISELEVTLEELKEIKGRVIAKDDQIAHLTESVQNKKQEIEARDRELNNYRREITSLQTVNRDILDEVSSIRQQLGTTSEKCKEHEKQKNSSNSAKALIEHQLKVVTRELEELKLAKQQNETNQRTVIKEIESEKQQRYAAETSLARMQSEHRDVLNELVEYERKCLSQQKTIDDLTKQIREVKAENSRTLKAKYAESESNRNRIEILERERAAVNVELERSQRKIQELNDELRKHENVAQSISNFTSEFFSERRVTIYSQKHEDQSRSVDIAPILSSPGKGKTEEHSVVSPETDETLLCSTEREKSASVTAMPIKLSGSVEVSLKILRSKITELENENRMREKLLQEAKSDLSQHKQLTTGLESKLAALQTSIQSLRQENESLQHRIASSDKLSLSQAETLANNESERQNLRLKILSAEMQMRDREARIQVLQDQLASLKANLATVEEEREILRKSESSLRHDSIKHESELHDCLKKLDLVNDERSQALKALQATQSQLQDCESKFMSMKEKFAQLEKSKAEYEEQISRLQAQESHWKLRAESISKTATLDSQHSNRRYESAKTALDTMTAKYKRIETERDQIKKEFMEVRTRLTTALGKISQLQATVKDLDADKKRSMERIEVLEKVVRESEVTIKEKIRIIEHFREERLSSIADVDEVRRQLLRSETALREFESQVARLKRECNAQKTHIEALEMDKRRIEAIIRQTTLERHALDKSLITMEKENAELYKNCQNLQNQLIQLEHEHNNRATDRNGRKILHLESEVHKLNQDKRQLEKLLNQREQNYEQKQKMLDGQLVELRTNLEQERKRRRQLQQVRQTMTTSQTQVEEIASTSMSPQASVTRTATYARRSLDVTSNRAPFRL